MNKGRLVFLLSVLVFAPECLRSFVINNNGCWCWFQDARAIIVKDNLIVGSVANGAGCGGLSRHGNIELATYNLKKHSAKRVVLNKQLEADDHDTPAISLLSDGRFLTMYTKHSIDFFIRARLSRFPYDSVQWDDEHCLKCEGKVCYSNIFISDICSSGCCNRIYNFYRGKFRKPCLAYSDDNGQSWVDRGVFIRDKDDVQNESRPYVRYAQNRKGEIHFIATRHHPNECVKSMIFYGFIRQGNVYNAKSVAVGDLADCRGIDISDLSLVCEGDDNTKLWVSDVAFDQNDNPFFVYTVHKNKNDNRYCYGYFNGVNWVLRQIAFGGECLYVTQQYYTGNISLDHSDINTAYISTNVDPQTGVPLISHTDGLCHYEIFKGTTKDCGLSWKWFGLTKNSIADNLRPIVPISYGGLRKVVIWLQGKYETYKRYKLKVVGEFI